MATVILLVVAVGVIAALTFAARTTSVTAQRTRALNLANQYIERARNLQYDLVGTYSDGAVYGDPPGSIHTPDAPSTMWDASHSAPTYGTDFTVVTKITWQRNVAGRSQYKNVEVVVSWTTPVASSIRLTTSIFGKTDLTNVGDLQLTLKDKSTNAPIAGIAVSITPAGATRARTVKTDANGMALFGMVPTGAASMTITTTDWVFDTSQPGDVPAINVATGDVLSSYTILGQKASNLRIRTLGTHGDALSGVTVSTVIMGQTMSGATDSAGYVVFAAVPPGVYSVAASRSDREPVTLSVTVPAPATPGQVVNGSITLHDPIAVLFRVNAAGSTGPQSGASVTLYTQAGVAVSSGETNGDGLVTLSALATGSYYALGAHSNAEGRHPAAAGTFIALDASDYGNQDAPVGQVTGGLVIQLSAPSIIGAGGGVFPYVVPITVDAVSHNSVNGTWNFLVTQVRAYSVQASYNGYRPFGGAVTVSALGQTYPVTALLDSLANMTVEVRGKWGQALLSGSTVRVAGPESDSVAASSGYAYFTAAQGHALYGTNQTGDSPYTVTAARSGYHDGTLTGVSLVPGQTFSPNPVIYLVTTRAGTFVITTRNNATNAIRPNATIRVTGPANSPDGISSYTVDYTSDAAGRITITDLPLGRYTFKYRRSASSYPNVSSPSSTTLSTDGQSLTFDVKW